MDTLTATLGPWKLERDRANSLSLYGDDDTFIGEVYLDQDEPSQEETANVLLLAAAPDLLAALRWIADHGDTGAGGRPAYHDMRDRARKAIAKAEGRN